VTAEASEQDGTVREVTTTQVLVPLLIGVLSGALILFWQPFWHPLRVHPLTLHGWSEKHQLFAKTSPFILWAALMCAQTGLWLLVLVWLRPSFRRVWPEKGKRLALVRLRGEAMGSTVAIAITVSIFVGGAVRLRSWPDYMPGHEWKVVTLTGVGALVGLFAAWGIWLTHAQLMELADRLRRGVLSRESALNCFLIHQRRVKRFLGALGAILGLLVLATAAHRQALLAYDRRVRPPDVEALDYGYQLVLIYGLFFSILIAAVYIPTHLSLTRVGNQIRDKFFKDVTPGAEDWQEQTANREKLGSLLELDVGPLGRLKASAAILTPWMALRSDARGSLVPRGIAFVPRGIASAVAPVVATTAAATTDPRPISAPAHDALSSTVIRPLPPALATSWQESARTGRTGTR
jgi:hypothetical protein